MQKPFSKLRGELTANDITQSYLRELMGKSQFYITQRITAKKPWTQDDQYFFMDLLNIPYEQMYKFFPKMGKAMDGGMGQ